MRRYLRLLFFVTVIALVTSLQAPGVQKPKPKPRVTTSKKATAKPKTGTVRKSPSAKTKNSSGKSASGKTTTALKKSPDKAQLPRKSAVVNVLPRLVDLGATTCIPCKMMAPVLEELAREYKGKLKVEFIDIRQNPQAARKYAVRVIPTQIFFDRKGEEFFRHEGFYSKEDILRKFKDQGIDLDK